jgi:hypothetical protein
VLLPVVKNMRVVNDSFCRETADLVCFMLSEIRTQ